MGDHTQSVAILAHCFDDSFVGGCASGLPHDGSRKLIYHVAVLVGASNHVAEALGDLIQPGHLDLDEVEIDCHDSVALD